MTDLHITHTAAEGTQIGGTARGDGSAAALKAHGWKWSRNLGAWYVPRSRDMAPNMSKIEATRAALQAAGFAVVVDAEFTARPTAQVEADRRARLAARAEALAAKAERHHAAAETAAARDHAAAESLPPMGQPILVGHHSEGRHRAAIARAHRAADQHHAARAVAQETTRRAEVATHSAHGAESPVTTAERIKRLEADRRRQLRRLDPAPTWITDEDGSSRLTVAHPSEATRQAVAAEVAHLDEQLGYWREVRAQQIAQGRATEYGPATVKAGDAIKVGGHWHRVVRANKASATVDSPLDSWTERVPWHKITAHKPQR